MKRKLFSIDTQLYKVTGVEKVMLDIHHAVRDDYEAKIVGTIPYKEVNKNHNIPYEEYIHFHNPLMFYNSIVIMHERRLLYLKDFNGRDEVGDAYRSSDIFYRELINCFS